MFNLKAMNMRFFLLLLVFVLFLIQHADCTDKGESIDIAHLPPIQYRKPPSQESFTVRLPGARPDAVNVHICSGFQLPNLIDEGHSEDIYVNGFKPINATAGKIHHIFLHLCPAAQTEEATWTCGTSYEVRSEVLILNEQGFTRII